MVAEKQDVIVLEGDNYVNKYSDGDFFDKIKNTVKSAGLKLIYEALQLFYVTRKIPTAR